MSVVSRSRIGMYVLVPLLLSVSSVGLAAPEKSGAEDKGGQHDPEARVCRKVKVTGSHLPQRVCLKRRQWDEMRVQAQRSLQDSRAHANAGGEGPR